MLEAPEALKDKALMQKGRKSWKKHCSAPNLVFHKLRLLRQALKKGRQFEVRKLCRRMHAEVKAKTDAVDAEALRKKFEAKLFSLKSTSLEEVFVCACTQLQVKPDGSSLLSEAPSAAVSAQEESCLTSWAFRRILGTGCVVEAMGTVRSQLIAASTAADTLNVENGSEEKKEGVPGDPEPNATTQKRVGKVLKRVGKVLKSGRRRTSSEDGRIQDNRNKERDKGTLFSPKEGSAGGADHTRNVDADQEGKIGRKRRTRESGTASVAQGKSRQSVDKRKQASKPGGRLLKGVPHKPKNRLGQRERRRLAERATAMLMERPHHPSMAQSSAGLSNRWGDRARQDKRPRQQEEQQGQVHGKMTPGPSPFAGQREALKSWATADVKPFPPKATEKVVAQGSHVYRSQRLSLDKGEKRGPVQSPIARGQVDELHPSWAAKRAMEKKLAVAGTGMKIRFNDDD